VEATRDSSSLDRPTNPTSAVGSSLVMPSSMPIPARRTGTTSGTGRASLTPLASATGVCTVSGCTRMPRVASYASRVTSSSVSRRNNGASVRESRKVVSLCAISG
jgi:hypothetical protein